MSKNIEVEARSFISEVEYANIKAGLDLEYGAAKELDEVTVYFSGEKDLRMRRSGEGAYVILKEGKLHDDSRREYEVRIEPADFDHMVELLERLGYEIEIEWYRKRREYKKGDTKVLLDDTRGYGRILELERLVPEGEAHKAHAALEEELKGFGIGKLSGREEFDERYAFYRENWKTLIR